MVKWQEWTLEFPKAILTDRNETNLVDLKLSNIMTRGWSFKPSNLHVHSPSAADVSVGNISSGAKKQHPKFHPSFFEKLETSERRVF